MMVLGIALLLTFTISDSYVDANGILHEPFVLTPLGWSFLLLGSIGIILKYGLIFVKLLKNKMFRVVINNDTNSNGEN